jgi:hypothetical protein
MSNHVDQVVMRMIHRSWRNGIRVVEVVNRLPYYFESGLWLIGRSITIFFVGTSHRFLEQYRHETSDATNSSEIEQGCLGVFHNLHLSKNIIFSTTITTTH